MSTASSVTPASPLFLGTNIPWHWFGYDIGGGAFDASWFDNYFASVSGKSNALRFFLHCDGRATPQFTLDGHVRALEKRAGALDARAGSMRIELAKAARPLKLMVRGHVYSLLRLIAIGCKCAKWPCNRVITLM